MADKVLTCRDCSKEFVFTEGEQQFFMEKGFTNEPGRCPDCRRNRRQSAGPGRTMYPATCAACGQTTEVPFQPRGDRPVYCRDCFVTQRGDQ